MLLTPKEVARRLAVSPRTVYSWIEEGRLPAVKLSERVTRVPAEAVEALRASSRRAPSGDPRNLDYLRSRREEIVAVAAAHHASNPRVFGSVARGQAGESSDVDVLFDFDDDASLFEISKLEIALSERFGVPFDIGPAQELDCSMRDRVLAEAVVL